jgi:hypothetical protein
MIVTNITAIIDRQPLRRTISSKIHSATVVAEPMKIAPRIVSTTGGLYVDSIIKDVHPTKGTGSIGHTWVS